jgi:8-oxo-dGTP diphosphatase
MIMQIIEVSAAIIMEQNRFLIGKRGKGNLEGYWEFPGGKLELGETKEEALIREIREELNLEIIIDEYLTFAVQEYKDTHTIVKIYFFISHIAGGTLTKNVHQKLHWVSLEELPSYRWLPANKYVLCLLLKKYGLF